jgi:hypothetical protein
MHQNAGKKTSKKCLVGDPPPTYVPPPHVYPAAIAIAIAPAVSCNAANVVS